LFVGRRNFVVADEENVLVWEEYAMERKGICIDVTAMKIHRGCR
jgi:hypothetical protein